MHTFTLFRLRQNEAINGYMKMYNHGIIDYSTDQFWWTSTPIDYHQKDVFSKLCDKNNRRLFEHDVVAMRTTPHPKPTTTAQMVYDHDRQTILLIDLTTHQPYELFAGRVPLIHKQELTFLGYAFQDNNDTC
ncbi:MAG: hypothetical protein ACO3K7_06160 [Candidatus Marinamargulisbacteria bacterium]